MPFTEKSSLETGFAQVFETDIAPQLGELDDVRHAARRKGLRNLLLTLLGSAAILGAVYLIWGDVYAVRLAPVVVIFGGILAWSAWAVEGDGWTAEVAERLMPVVCAHVGNMEYSASGRGINVGAFRDLRLLPDYDNSHLRASLTGTYRGRPYQIAQAHLTTTTHDGDNRSRTETRFRGLLLRIEVADPAPGRIVMMRDRGGLGNKIAETFAFGSTRSLPKLQFDSQRFEAAFEVYAEDPEKGRAYMTDARVTAMMEIGKSRDANAFVAGYAGQYLHIVIKRSDPFLRAGRITADKMDIEADLHGMFKDVGLSHRIIDQLLEAD